MWRTVLLISVVGSVALAAEGSRIPNERSTDDLRLLVGIAPPIRQAAVEGLRQGSGAPTDQSLSSRPSVGPRGGLRYLHGTWLSTDGGLKYGLDAVVSRSTGALQDDQDPTADDRDFVLTSAGVALVGGPTVRLDVDALESPADFVEVEILGSVGPALMRASNEKIVSAWSTGLRGGLSLGVVVTRFDRWQIGAEVGGEWLHTSTLRWSNTGDAMVNAWGLTGGLQLGRRW